VGKAQRAHHALAPRWARRFAPLPTLHVEQKFVIRIVGWAKRWRAHHALAPRWARRFAPLPTLHFLFHNIQVILNRFWCVVAAPI
jgi:hypothetical protein